MYVVVAAVVVEEASFVGIDMQLNLGVDEHLSLVAARKVGLHFVIPNQLTMDRFVY